jgi:hypothetical protein
MHNLPARAQLVLHTQKIGAWCGMDERWGEIHCGKLITHRSHQMMNDPISTFYISVLLNHTVNHGRN